ncbi:MAG: NADPH:quinone oxidoreductase family protein [Alphaproteobacteria bacterium]|nr:NADPH:quinone oxidoreductase family protein [Alphaproteobacteria bacterium]
MKAVLCREFGAPSVLTVEEIEAPRPGPEEVRIAVRAVGVNFPDLLLVAGKYQARPPFPFSPGIESAGEVIEVGPEVEDIRPGDRVFANHSHGGFAEEVVAPAATVYPMPETMSFEQAAAFPVAYGTGYHGLVQRGALAPGETLLVHGAGSGVGLVAVELGKLLGATVIATAGSALKLEVAREYGADHLINYREEKIRERVKEFTAGAGADVVYDPVGGDVMDESVRCINWGGRILVIGFASGRFADIPSNLVLIKGMSVVGVYWGSFAARNPERNRENLRVLLEWFAQGKVKPLISRSFALEEAAAALEALEARKVTGKAVLVPR